MKGNDHGLENSLVTQEAVLTKNKDPGVGTASCRDPKSKTKKTNEWGRFTKKKKGRRRRRLKDSTIKSNQKRKRNMHKLRRRKRKRRGKLCTLTIRVVQTGSVGGRIGFIFCNNGGANWGRKWAGGRGNIFYKATPQQMEEGDASLVDWGEW